jgi:hypothetical protein
MLDRDGAMCAFADVGPEYNRLPLAVTNVEGTEDAASADQFVPLISHFIKATLPIRLCILHMNPGI